MAVGTVVNSNSVAPARSPPGHIRQMSPPTRALDMRAGFDSEVEFVWFRRRLENTAGSVDLPAVIEQRSPHPRCAGERRAVWAVLLEYANRSGGMGIRPILTSRRPHAARRALEIDSRNAGSIARSIDPIVPGPTRQKFVSSRALMRLLNESGLSHVDSEEIAAIDLPNLVPARSPRR